MFPPFFEMPLTYTFTSLFILISIFGFYHKPFYQALIYHPYEVFRGNRVHTLFTSAFIHKGWKHLLINVYLFYFMSKDLEYIILEVDYNANQIKLIWIFLFIIPTCMTNFIIGWLHRGSVLYTNVGASGTVFSFMAFSALYLPLDHIKKINKLIPLYYGYQFALALLILFVLLMVVFPNSKNNHKAHVCALWLGFIFAIIFRPVLMSEIIKHLRLG